jgi:hypothetical protein
MTKPSDLECEKIAEILDRGNTAEVKRVKGGITVLEVSRRIRSRQSEGDGPENTSGPRRGNAKK